MTLPEFYAICELAGYEAVPGTGEYGWNFVVRKNGHVIFGTGSGSRRQAQDAVLQYIAKENEPKKWPDTMMFKTSQRYQMGWTNPRLHYGGRSFDSIILDDVP